MRQLVNKQLFLLRQPTYPKVIPSDPYYYDLCNQIAVLIEDQHLLKSWPEGMSQRVALALTGYLQDILTDSGLWRSFISQCLTLYGRWLPFYPVDEQYIPHELNLQDVRFLIWYILTMYSEERRVSDPMDEEIKIAAEIIHSLLDKVYEDPEAPHPQEYHIARELDLRNPEETDEVFRFGHWLFMDSYLLTPAFAMTLSEMMANPELQGGKNHEMLRKMLEEAMMEVPTGPLALYLREWLFLIINGKMPPEPKKREDITAEEHPYYTRFIAATDGIPIKFFATYDELNRFFIDALGWDDTDNLPALKGSSDFVLLVNREKGMLCARNVAKCIKIEGNQCYDKEYAREHAIDLLTVRGLCPADLLHFIFEHDALPDAHFPGCQDYDLVKKNRDFIARLYLQQYYRGD